MQCFVFDSFRMEKNTFPKIVEQSILKQPLFSFTANDQMIQKTAKLFKPVALFCLLDTIF